MLTDWQAVNLNVTFKFSPALQKMELLQPASRSELVEFPCVL